MNTIETYIGSGVLELYVLGAASAEEAREVERMAAAHPQVREEIEAIRLAMESYADAHAVEPHPTIQPLLLATIDYMERLKKGEAPTAPPILHENSKPSDYKAWLDRPDMVAPAGFDEIFAKIIGANPQATTAIVWLRSGAPLEVHDDEHEKFLIIEGSCDIVIDGKAHQMKPGDYMSIPLHSDHYVKVTSPGPCKVVLQRVAA